MIAIAACPISPKAPAVPLTAGPRIDAREFSQLRRRLVLDHCKWDPQVGDASTLAPFPLIISHSNWTQLANDAQRLADETIRAEQLLLHSPRLQKTLGVPWSLQRVLKRAGRSGLPPIPVRAMRFDFHWTSDGWRISEVNSDVPGGYCEASAFTQLVAAHFPALVPAGDPARKWAEALDANSNGPIALLAAPGFMEDQQVTAYLASQLQKLGRRTHLTDPAQLEWRDGHAYLNQMCLGAIVRFYQAEWLTRLSRRCGWRNMIAGGRTPVTNAGSAIFTESKRFPLVWDELPCDFSAWRRLLPETRDPRDAPWETGEHWLIKSAYCNTGDTVTIRAMATAKRWANAARDARRHPDRWLAQRRFTPVAIDSPEGPVYPCIGVYVIDGQAAGAYARISRTPIVDFRAADVALLLKEDAIDE